MKRDDSQSEHVFPMSAIEGDLAASGLKIGVVTARFNQDVTSQLESGALEELRRLGLQPHEVTVLRVPGAVEIPLVCQKLLELGFDGVVALGCVIRGETAHFDYVCESVERGCSKLQLEFGRPISFGVLTTENLSQALERAGGRHGNKGVEAAQVVVEMVRLLQKMESNLGI